LKGVEATLLLEGELGERDLFEVGEKLFRLAHLGCQWVVLDFSDVSHVDYRGVRALMSRRALFRRAGGDIKLSGLSPYLRKIFRAAGAHGAFEVYPRASDARHAVEARRLEPAYAL
jgi:anti-sigma B factor antagonist